MEEFGTGGFGESDFSDGPSKYVKEKSIPQGVSRFRILPQMKSLAHKKDGWKMWGAVHYGYSGTKKGKPDETVQRPFGCVQKKDRAGNIYARCTACDEHAKFKAEAKIHEADLAKRGLSP